MANYGMVAFGRSGNWELAIDEVIGEAQKWVLKIESPLVSLQCGVPSLAVFASLEGLLKSCESKERQQIGTLQIGIYYGRPVRVTLDTEFADRCFITIGDSASGRFEVTLAGENYCDLREAVSQVVSELELEG